MKFSPISWFISRPAILGVVATLLLSAISVGFTWQRYMWIRTEETREMENKAKELKSNIETALNYSLSATKTLSLIVSRYDGARDFDAAAAEILRANSYIDALELVEGGVITRVYPLEGNEEAIGYDILKDSSRNKEALEAIDRNELFFAGPIRLKQGYPAIVGRLPIFVGGKFWGFSAVLIKMSTFVRAAGMDSLQNTGFAYQLSKIDPNTGEEIFFLPHPEYFNEKETLVSETVPSGNWKIYVRLIQSHQMAGLMPAFILGLLFSVTGGLLAWNLARQPFLLRQKVHEKTELLRNSEEKFRSLVEQNRVGVFIAQNRSFLYVNPGFRQTLGYEEQELLDSMAFEDILCPEDREEGQTDAIAQAPGAATPAERVIRAVRKDGTIIHLEVIASAIEYNGQPAVIGTTIDITDRVEEERRISRAVAEAQEMERIQIGMELHDNVKQILAASLMTVDFLKAHPGDKDLLRSGIDRLRKYLNESIQELRRLSHQLAPSADQMASLEDKINALVAAMNTGNRLEVSVSLDDFPEPPREDVQIVIYRILQEQFSNILRHANASSVAISLKQDGNWFRFSIRDNGCGFDPTVNHEGIGLVNIRRRAQTVNGKVSIHTTPGKGCTIVILLPMERASEVSFAESDRA